MEKVSTEDSTKLTALQNFKLSVNKSPAPFDRQAWHNSCSRDNRTIPHVSGLFLLALLGLLAPRPHDPSTQVAQIMNGRSGSAMVMEINSGKLLATYHPEVAARRLARPGSAFKPFILLALMRSSKLGPSESFVCRRNLHVGTHDLSCSHPQTGPLTAVSALAYSCNDFFATLGLRLTAEELRSAFTTAGLSSPGHLLPDEATGSIRLAQSDEERQLQAVGEGDMKVTPVEMLAAYRALARRRTARDATSAERTVFAGLEASAEYGMARLASVPGMKVAGKTGTPRSTEGAWTNGWFAGYAPADHPRVVVVIFLERGEGPDDAAPLAGQIFHAWFEEQPR
jgi:membrane peptidoglycan carboxypeptidase